MDHSLLPVAVLVEAVLAQGIGFALLLNFVLPLGGTYALGKSSALRPGSAGGGGCGHDVLYFN